VAALTFFFDRCTGSGVPKLLRQAKPPFGVQFHDEPSNGFSQNMPDDEWLAVVSKKQWVVISHDKRFHEDSLAIEAVRQHKARVFYLCGGSLPNWDKLRIFAQAFKRIKAIVETQEPPYIYQVTYTDRVLRVRGI